ncbi:unnamed protein product [Schistocephalus solidus]|uniref:Proteasome subunit beta type-1 n=1 Tax=Schistocephalus solidus TaxID=70667 RepID=A0A183SKY5_SCHSO|nr:unnamed protein product [Schistocephalus solidus]
MILLSLRSTTLAIAGDDYALVASDTRLTDENAGLLFSRNSPHIYDILKFRTPTIRICLTGFHGDILTFIKLLETRVKASFHEFKYHHKKDISLTAMANLISISLYSRRFFPFYVGTLLAGLDENGEGAVFSYDPVGSYQREHYRATGTGSAILQPFMDSQIQGMNLVSKPTKISREAAINLAKDIFISAAERDIFCGDAVVVDVITQKGVERLSFPLRRD